jgi:hypothetical protein
VKANSPAPVAVESATDQVIPIDKPITPEACEAKDPSLISEYDECPRCPTCVSLPCVTILLKIASHPMLLQVRVH